MTRLQKGGYSMRQGAYARRIWGGRDQDKKSIALDVGYSPSVSNTPHSKIEIHKGFNNAMAALANESNNLALKILYEFESRGVKDFSNKDLVAALNAIGQAWSKFNKGALESERADSGQNRLRTIILQRVENQTIATPVAVEESVQQKEDEF